MSPFSILFQSLLYSSNDFFLSFFSRDISDDLSRLMLLCSQFINSTDVTLIDYIGFDRNGIKTMDLIFFINRLFIVIFYLQVRE